MNPATSPVAVGDWMTLDISQAVIQEFAGEKTISIMVSSNGTGNLDFYSRENIVGSPPQILINASGANNNSRIAPKKMLEKKSEEAIKIFPNPIDEQSVIVFTLEEKAAVTVKISDFSGRLIHEYKAQITTPGEQTIQWKDITNGTRLKEGIYHVIIDFGSSHFEKKVMVSE